MSPLELLHKADQTIAGLNSLLDGREQELAALRQQLEEARARVDVAEGKLEISLNANQILKQRLANAEAQEPVLQIARGGYGGVLWPLDAVMPPDGTPLYREPFPAPPDTDERVTCARCKGSGIVSLGNNPHAYGSATCNVCGGSGKGISLSLKQSAQGDKVRMDWLEAQAAAGHISICFELDGGVHVTLDPVGEVQRAARNVASIREGIDALAASKADGKGGDAS